MKHAEKIIRAVRGRPHLYDQTLQTTKYSGRKNKDWSEVAQIVYGRDDKTTVNRVKIQWKSLRDAFVKSQRRYQNGSSKLRPYIYEEDMHFLIPHILKKDLCAPVADVRIKTEDGSSFNATASEDSAAEADLHEEAGEDTKVSAFEALVWGDDREPREKCGEQECERQQKEKREDRSLGNGEAHPVDAFFHGIAQTVKQLKPATVARLKKAVANIVIDAEIEELEKNEPV